MEAGWGVVFLQIQLWRHVQSNGGLPAAAKPLSRKPRPQEFPQKIDGQRAVTRRMHSKWERGEGGSINRTCLLMPIR